MKINIFKYALEAYLILIKWHSVLCLMVICVQLHYIFIIF